MSWQKQQMADKSASSVMAVSRKPVGGRGCLTAQDPRSTVCAPDSSWCHHRLLMYCTHVACRWHCWWEEKSPHRFMCLNTWCPDGGAIFKSCGTSKRENLSEQMGTVDKLCDFRSWPYFLPGFCFLTLHALCPATAFLLSCFLCHDAVYSF